MYSLQHLAMHKWIPSIFSVVSVLINHAFSSTRSLAKSTWYMLPNFISSWHFWGAVSWSDTLNVSCTLLALQCRAIAEVYGLKNEAQISVIFQPVLALSDKQRPFTEAENDFFMLLRKNHRRRRRTDCRYAAAAAAQIGWHFHVNTRTKTDTEGVWKGSFHFTRDWFGLARHRAASRLTTARS